MYGSMLAVFAFVLLGVVLGCLLLSPVVFLRQLRIARRLERLERELRQRGVAGISRGAEPPPPPPRQAPSAARPGAPADSVEPGPPPAPSRAEQAPAAPAAREPAERGETPPPRTSGEGGGEGIAEGLGKLLGRGPGGFELQLGQKWLVWVGMVFMLIGGGLFLKYMYDNSVIGPAGRVAIGTAASLTAVGLGERFRRKDWRVLFTTLTGGGLGGLYLCVFFSFQAYALSGQSLSFALAVLVTVTAIALAVGHGAVSIAVVGVIGGFLSPVVLSTGENHPYILFGYIAVLDAVALGAAYYRRWPGLNSLCLAGTALVYQGWYMRFYGAADEPSQLWPALIFASLFYLMFLLIPTLYCLVRRRPATLDSVMMVALNAVYWLYSYHRILFDDYRQALGFIVLGQAMLAFLLFHAWTRRVGEKGDRMGETLLVTALALVTLAVPIQLRFYAVPIVWAVEAALFAYIGARFGRVLVRGAALVAIPLAVYGLLDRLPLHTLRFTPVFNVPFGSWLVVIACFCAATWAFLRGRERTIDSVGALVSGGAAFALLCLVLSQETGLAWRYNHWQGADWRVHLASSLAVLWAGIPLASAWAGRRYGGERWQWFLPAWLSYGVGCIVFLAGAAEYDLDTRILIANGVFLPRLLFPVSLWLGAWMLRRSRLRVAADALVVAGHVALVVLAALELWRWGEASELVDERMGVSLISAAWALHALVLVWLGLATRNKSRRVLGFLLFGLTIAKVCFFDLSTLDREYQIVSFMGSGALLFIAGYFYQRYSPRLLDGAGGGRTGEEA